MFVFVLCGIILYSFSFSIILKRKRERELVALLLLSYGCLVTVNVLWLFPTVLCVGLQCLIVVFPYHTHFFICIFYLLSDILFILKALVF